MSVGIDDIRFYTTNYYLNLSQLADANGFDPDKYTIGIGQEQMSVPGADEDIVTMAASASLPLLQAMQARGEDQDTITTVLFATETGIDQSKAAGIYVHALLGLSTRCRVVELKQACYSATAAIHMACALVARQPSEKTLVVAADVARYERNSPGEATQGCGAVAMIISHNPRLLEIAPETGKYTEDVMDFWRPNYRSAAIVDGKYSTKIYLQSVKRSWRDYQQQSGLSFADFDYFCYHLPFSRMAEKAHTHLTNGFEPAPSQDEMLAQINDSLIYNRVTGNSYTAAMYIGLVSLLDNSHADLTGKRIGFFSYGSGCVAEFYAGTVVSGYQTMLHQEAHQKMLDTRLHLSYESYVQMYGFESPTDGGNHDFAAQTNGHFRLAGVRHHKRIYEAR
jgi:hydroxymethylglutaryl-CoA synthase